MSVSAFPYGCVAAAGVGIDFSNIVSNATSRNGATAICNVKIDNDGSYYISDELGAFTSVGVYVLRGDSGDVWVERTIDSGTLTTDGIGASGRAACTSDRTLGVTQTTQDIKTCTVTLEFFDASVGGSSLGSKQITLTAEYI